MAQKAIRISTDAPSITVVQGAYKLYCAREVQTEYYRDVGDGDPRPIDSLGVGVVFVTDPHLADWLKFQSLIIQWHHERGASSSITEAALCPAYQSIIGMGKTAIPFIFAQLKSEGDEPDQWFWALKAVTGADPVADEDRGDFLAMTQKWLQWAERDVYAW